MSKPIRPIATTSANTKPATLCSPRTADLSATRQSPILYQANAPYPAMALSSITLEGLDLLSFLIWLALFFGWGHFWRVWEFDTDHAQFPSPAKWPGVTAVIPARNEAASIAEVVRALALQDYAVSLFLLDALPAEMDRESWRPDCGCGWRMHLAATHGA